MIKFTILVRRNPELTQEEFEMYWGKHALLLASLPLFTQSVGRYVRSLKAKEEIPGLPLVTFDGTVELWFDSLADLTGIMQSKEYIEVIRPDEERFIDHQNSEFLLTTETV